VAAPPASKDATGRPLAKVLTLCITQRTLLRASRLPCYLFYMTQNTADTKAGPSGQEGGLPMEASVREFARQYPTANVRRMLALCEAGTITWAQAHGIAVKAMRAGLAEVAS
jgi:hypothetical protein